MAVKKRPNWMEQMAQSPFSKSQFTTELKEKIMSQINSQKVGNSSKLTQRRKLFVSIVCSLIIIFGGVGLLWKPTNVVEDIVKYAKTGITPVDKSWDVRQQYKSGGNVLFSVYPDGGMTAGKRYNYLWVFERSLDQLKNNLMSVKATYQATNEVLNVVPDIKISKTVRRTESQLIVMSDDQLFDSVVIEVK